MSGSANLPEFMPISFFRRVSRFWGVSGHLALQQGKSQCILECCPVLSLDGLKLGKLVTLSKRNHYPPKTITWIQGNFPRSWSQREVPFRHCQKTCRRVNAGAKPDCEQNSWTSLPWEVGGWISEGIRQTTWLENANFSGGKHS